MNTLKLLFFIIIFCYPFYTYTYASEERTDMFEEQDFLFLAEGAYTQEQFETQVEVGFQVLKGRFQEQEFEDDFDTVEKKGQRRQVLRLPMAIEFGIMDWWEVEIETEYQEVRNRSWEINDAGTQATSNEDDFGDIVVGNTIQLLHEKDHRTLPTVALGMELVLPTGDFKEEEVADKQVGYEWVLKMSKRWQSKKIPGDIFVHLNLGFGITPHVQGLNEGLERSKPHDLRELSYALSTVWRFLPQWSLLLELSHEIEEEIELNHRISESELVFLPGISFRGDIRELVEWEVGAGFPIGLTSDADDWGFATKLSLEV